MKFRVGRGIPFKVLEINADDKRVLGFMNKNDIAIWYDFIWFTPNQIKRMEEAYKKNGKYFRY